MPNGLTPFRSTNVRPFAGTPADNSPPQEPHPQPQENEREDPQDYTPVYTELAFAPPTVNAPAAHVCFFATEQSPETFLREVIKDDPERFREARSKEMHGLLDRGTFEVVPATDAEGYRQYGGRFVDEIKNAGTPHAYEKSRFVVQAFND